MAQLKVKLVKSLSRQQKRTRLQPPRLWVCVRSATRPFSRITRRQKGKVAKIIHLIEVTEA